MSRRKRATRLPAWVDAYLPFRGECAFCGGPDARHRMTDAMVDFVKAGDSIEAVARDYEVPVELVRRLVAESSLAPSPPPAAEPAP